MKILLLLLFGLQSADPAAPVATASDATDFARRLEACTPSVFSMPHPFMRGFTIRHEIVAEHHENACEYTQTMPGDMRMECLFTGEGRKQYAGEFEALAAGRLSGGSGQSPPWADECEIVAADGRRMPMAPDGD